MARSAQLEKITAALTREGDALARIAAARIGRLWPKVAKVACNFLPRDEWVRIKALENSGSVVDAAVAAGARHAAQMSAEQRRLFIDFVKVKTVADNHERLHLLTGLVESGQEMERGRFHAIGISR